MPSSSSSSLQAIIVIIVCVAFASSELLRNGGVLSNKKATRGDCDAGITREDIVAAFQLSQPTASCLECEIAVEATRIFIGKNATEHAVADIIIFFCKALKVEDPYICTQVITEFEDLFMYMLVKGISAQIICAELGVCDMPVFPTWNVTFETPQPPVKPYPTVNDGPKIFVLHISDLHVDPEYTPGLESNCGEPLCCRPPNKQGVPGNIAGKFGDYNCDLPTWVYEDMLNWIRENLPEIDYAIFTGDMPPHDVWAETRNSSLTMDQYETNMFRKILPHVPLFPAVGNHEAVPVNEFVPRDISDQWDMSWLYTPLSEMWSPWLPDDAIQTVKYAGYYTALTNDGTRIVSLNTNLGCNNENVWLSIPSEENADPDQQLHWFEQVLRNAEKANETVYIIMHIAPEGGKVCSGNWWENYFKIVERYQNNIIASFAGHTHADIVRTTYTQDHNTSNPYRPFLTTFFPGSVTPYQPNNPGFRVYQIDAKTKAVADFREYYANLTDANIKGKIVWELEYSARHAYQMKDLSPASWRDFALRAWQDESLLESYASHRGKLQIVFRVFGTSSSTFGLEVLLPLFFLSFLLPLCLNIEVQW